MSLLRVLGDQNLERLLENVNHLSPTPSILSLSKDCFSFKRLCVRHEEKDSPSTSSGKRVLGQISKPMLQHGLARRRGEYSRQIRLAAQEVESFSRLRTTVSGNGTSSHRFSE